MQKIVLLGATGFIGSNIAQELNCRGRDWLGVSRSGGADSDFKTVKLVDDSLKKALDEKPIVINAIGGLKPRDFEENFESAMTEFWNLTNTVLNLLRDKPPSLLMQISSAGTIYGDALFTPSVETDSPAPSSWYGRMKLVEEALFQQLAATNNVPFICARVSNPFGNVNHPKHGLVDVLVDHIREGKVFNACFPKGAQRDFIYAPEMARILVDMIDRPVPGVFNVASGESIKLQELIQFVRSKLPNALIKETISTKTDVRCSSLCTEKLSKTYGLRASSLTAFEYLRNELFREE
ncbi:NAD(P)-dependent oxidoreductase [Vreelandella aquamarina]|uniref:NAD-dependent epimerase/dehydratase domain-containing protein n=1 Tax=Vreelandella aquamarina TaxID=77097 RepID=A0A857GM29_9GAMM|nr:NAD-dependent epimerase/dehydratase family protein [Halomonas meridiana]QHD50388.1 hypothetical protein CTT34_12175 [Halomonas meridiana]